MAQIDTALRRISSMTVAPATTGVDVKRSSTLNRDGGRRSSGFSLAMIVRTVQLMADRSASCRHGAEVQFPHKIDGLNITKKIAL
jgi:hypothetical protein